MLKKTGLGGLFAQKSGHPLADPREVRRILGEIPRDNAFNALDALVGWLRSLAVEENLPVERMYEIISNIEAEAMPHLERLSREYLHGPRLSRAEEKRLWSINIGFWRQLADVYDYCLARSFANGRPPEAMRARLPELSVHLIGALGAILKWEHFQNGCGTNDIWRRLGHALLAALRERCASEPVSLPGALRQVSPLQAYDQVMVLHTAALDSLRPQEIELAERLLTYFLPRFGCTTKALHDSLYWVDFKLAQPPQRLAKMPEKALPTQRFFKPDAAHEVMVGLLERLERGEPLPEDLNLGYAYPAIVLRAVMRHLVTYLSPTPPLREHPRHRVRHRMRVVCGLTNALAVFSGTVGGRGLEEWRVEDVSLGGFGATQHVAPGDGAKVGSLLSMQPAGGDNWLPGVVRRLRRFNENEARLGIMLLSRQAWQVQLFPHPLAPSAMAAGHNALVLDSEESESQRVLMAPNAANGGGSLEYLRDGRRFLLEPDAVLEQTSDYVLARYHQSRLA